MELGQTIPGRQAVLKMLHPCMEHCDTVVKIPDGAVSTSVVMERRDEFELSNQTPSTTTYEMLIMHTPFLVGSGIAIQWASTVSPTVEQINYVAKRLIAGPGNAGATYPVWEALSTAPDIWGTILASSTLSPAVAGDTDPNGIKLSALIKNIRRTFMGTTLELDASDLYNQGRIISGQWTPDVTLGTVATSAAGDLTDVYDVYKFQLPAVSTSAIVQSDEFSRQAELKTGSYMPIRPCSPELNFTSSEEWRQIQVDYAGADSGTFGRDPTFNDLWLKGWCVGVEYLTNIDVRSQIRIKRREGLELVPSPPSTYSPFATPALPDDVRAKQVLLEFCRKQPHAYPADYNDLGEMIPNILGGLADVVSDLGLPLISPVVKFAKGLLMPKPTAQQIVQDFVPLVPHNEPLSNPMDELSALLKKLIK
jgi:hypothetical protein